MVRLIIYKVLCLLFAFAIKSLLISIPITVMSKLFANNSSKLPFYKYKYCLTGQRKVLKKF